MDTYRRIETPEGLPWSVNRRFKGNETAQTFDYSREIEFHQELCHAMNEASQAGYSELRVVEYPSKDVLQFVNVEKERIAA